MITTALSRFRDTSIRNKVMFVTVAACLVALFSVAGGLYAFQLRHFRKTFEQELRGLSRVMAENSAVALALNDSKTAKEVMSPLTVKAEVMNAGILGADGKSFAEFGKGDEYPPPNPGDPAGIVDRGASWTVVEPIVMDGKRIGTFFMDVDFATPRRELQRLFLYVTGSALAGSLLLVVLLTTQLQKVITRPIQLLVGASEAVARDHDYSVRVNGQGNDEVGVLTDAFNQMLGQIQMQDSALQGARQKLGQQLSSLQQEVAGRKRAQAEQANLTAIIEGTPDFVGNADVLGRVLYLNPAARSMIGLDEGADISGMKMSDLHPGWAARIVSTEGIPGAIHEGSWAGETAVLHRDGREIHVSQVIIAQKNADGGIENLSTVMRDISERKAAEEALRISQQELLASSRLAGMAEVATGVLHNVGNVLNSVNISASLTMEKLRGSKVGSLAKVSAMLAEHAHDLGDFLTKDPQGQRVQPYLQKLSGFLMEENTAMCTEIEHLARNIEHIKEIVAMQQSYACVTGVLEDVPPERLIEDALQINTESFARHGIDIRRNFQPAPSVRVDKHKVLQILINLLRNAKHAVEDSRRPDPRIGIIMSPVDGHVEIRVTDNGVGISPQNMPKVFRHGFTTKKNGHGFGLHSGALAAKEMGGALSASSDGPGMGATFTLTLPVAAATSAS